jgi:type IV secretion system protein VirB6
MMISPIGTFLQGFDTNITTAMNAGVTGLTAYMALPVQTSIAIYYVIRGIKIAQGDGGPVQTFVTDLLRNIVILWFCSNAAIYNQWAINVFFVGIPTALNKAVFANAAGDLPAAATMAGGVTGTAAQFDQVWAILDGMISKVWEHADFWDVPTKMAAEICAITGGLALLVVAMVYLMSRFILAIVLELGVVAIACLMFDATKPIFERWLGKVIALIFLQVTVIVVLQIVMYADVQYMTQMQAAFAGQAGVPSEVQGLVGVITMLLMGAFAVYSLPAIAYSIGTGVAIHTSGPMMLAARAAAAAVGGLPSGGGAAIPALALSEELSMGLPQAEMTGASAASIAAPSLASLPPPPLSLPGA